MTDERPLVLVLEDDDYASELLAMRVEQQGFRCQMARDASEALAIARAERPALVIVDLKLGEDINAGVAFLRELRADEATRGLVAVVHSIYVSRQTELDEAATLADGMLPKPFKREELQALLDRLELAPRL